MNCKNCHKPLKEKDNFCNHCGAKIILKRITFKKLLIEFFINIFGIDSRFFLTLKKMATHPQDVINEYIGGVRRRYINPFAFLAVGAGLSVIIFNYFADDFIKIQQSINSSNIKDLEEKATKDISNVKNLSEKEVEKLKIEKKIAQSQLKFMQGMWSFMLRYFNLLTFVFLLLYAVLSKWTFLKPHNFGEHIIINAYIYGFITYFTLVAFFLAILIHPSIYGISFITMIIYYMYVLGKLYTLSIGKNILKLFRFLFGLIVMVIVLIIISFLIGFLMSSLGLIKF